MVDNVISAGESESAEHGYTRQRASTAVSILPLIASLVGQEVLCEDSEDEAAPACCSGFFASCGYGAGASAGVELTVIEDGSDSKQTDDLSLSLSSWSLDASDGDMFDIRRQISDRGAPMMQHSKTSDLFKKTETAPAIGGLVCIQPHSEHLLPPEVVLFEPTSKEMGKPYNPDKKSEKRSIFLNTKLAKTEQDALLSLHKALEAENMVTKEGDGQFPEYVQVHALRILQQAKFDTNKAIDIMLTHMNMRVKSFPISESDVMQGLRKGLMYWHGRDKKGRPCLVWRMDRMDGFTPDSAVKLVLFVLEYAIRFALVPGRVENWDLIVDLEGVGLGSAGSDNREIAKRISILLEQVYCGRNFTTKIMSLPWVVRSIVNGFIPADKKEKVQFVGEKEMQTVMLELFEPEQLEQRYGGTAKNLEPEETYPFNFFPNATGKNAEGCNSDKSLHMFTDRTFHEGCLLDESVSDKWVERVKKQSLTTSTLQDLNSNMLACKDITSWLQLVNPEEAKRRASQ